MLNLVESYIFWKWDFTNLDLSSKSIYNPLEIFLVRPTFEITQIILSGNSKALVLWTPCEEPLLSYTSRHILNCVSQICLYFVRFKLFFCFYYIGKDVSASTLFNDDTVLRTENDIKYKMFMCMIGKFWHFLYPKPIN